MQRRAKQKSKKQYFSDEIKCYATDLIKEDLSSGQIVGKSKKDGVNCFCHETIYKYVWNDKKSGSNL